VLLDALWVAIIRTTSHRRILRVRKAENIIALVWNRGCRLPASVAWSGRTTRPIQRR
jgi:hypothetical protein